ncbi:aryl-alcohol oxidase precursor [Mycena albidolilacea]|uniref:Aryl-alcohol oxidase n=1 Tax=Mycena albidolilacea TaxID=1033008 RepID=A0AAD6ZM41_9AGAR|nr:aryl-alcohol oxidase precursor [Mycena albidolilacea]
MPSIRIHLYLVLLLSARWCFGAIYESIADLPKHKSFDFIVIGGGTAGNVVANRLTENPHFSVLVLEAGPSPEGLINYTVPFFNVFLRQSNPRDWNYTLTAIPGLNGRVVPFPRGRLLGGSSAMNGVVYVRGSKADYDGYAAYSGDPGWAWDAIQPYIRKNEHWTVSTDRHSESGKFNLAVHGFHGINAVSLPGFTYPVVDARVKQVTEEMTDQFPFNRDYNSGFPLGVSWTQNTIKHGKRSSSFSSYLGPEFIGRPNLHVVLNAQATRLIQTSQGPKEFKTVEFAQTEGGIICSDCPVLVLIRPHSKLGIQPRVNLPEVGKNLSVHMGVSLPYFVNGTDTFDDIIRNLTYRQILLDQWKATNGGGPLGVGFSSHTSFARLSPDSPVLKTHPDPAPGPRSPHFQSGTQNGNINPPPEGHFLSVGATLLTPTSRGTIQLNGTNPFSRPLIDLACLTTDFDISALREGMKSALRFIEANACETGDADLEIFARAKGAPNYHIIGTASMSPKGANYSVVDPDLLVKKIQHLRVVDASVLPFLPAGNTQAAVYIVAERAADLIKSKWQ